MTPSLYSRRATPKTQGQDNKHTSELIPKSISVCHPSPSLKLVLHRERVSFIKLPFLRYKFGQKESAVRVSLQRLHIIFEIHLKHHQSSLSIFHAVMGVLSLMKIDTIASSCLYHTSHSTHSASINKSSENNQ